MKVHVGSIDEEYDEKGIAHMIEHVAFLGSKKHEKLLGTGARSNAYIDFHHTVPRHELQPSSSGSIPVLETQSSIIFTTRPHESYLDHTTRGLHSSLPGNPSFHALDTGILTLIDPTRIHSIRLVLFSRIISLLRFSAWILSLLCFRVIL
ncbi:hypothetical protein CQW23_14718 [Capsicum baccatum]|uniref:Peptidase M16 N-terminal domain-containing protein n=1 Tax=Capsicum baccatum TaxID=33114 RepID=A0A2G2WK79_CAPBA|nr:hypothetical protein CQW23_14718 [Capsicum baccatum]